ncbi:MAG: tetratricopeptide repeat protein [Candidatus Hydrogenedentes bacterium]|nr:tetratricopeptide repeat protein [Candidatus Hydrogenedentota bacterium]
MSDMDSANPADPPQQASLSPLIAQDEIDALLAKTKTKKAIQAPPLQRSTQEPVPAPPPFVSGHDLGLISQDEIDTLLTGTKQPGRQAAPPEPSVAAALPTVSAIDQKEIDKLLAEAESEPTNFAAAEAALRKIDQAELDAIRTNGNPRDKLGDEAPLVDATADSQVLTQDELDKLLASTEPETQLGGGELDAVLAATDQAAPQEPAVSTETAPVTLGQDELDALLAAHPMLRAEPPSSLPIAKVSDDDPIERAARDNAQANVGRENLAAAVPDPTAGDQPLGQDLIDSLLAQAAQAAATPAAPQLPHKLAPLPSQGSELKAREVDAVALSDDDFADLGISLPPTSQSVSLVSEPADEAREPTEDASPVVQRRLRKGAKFPVKLAAAIAASIFAGVSTFAYLWSHREGEPEVAPAHVATEKEPIDLEEAIILAKELMGKGEHVSAMRTLGTAIRGAEPSRLLNEARFLHVEAGYRSLPPNPKDVDIETVLKNIEDVVALAPEYSRNPEALTWKAELYERGGALTLARDTYERILNTYPNTFDRDNTLLQLARISMQLNYYPDAEKSLNSILADHPDSPHKSEAQMMLAKCYESTGRVPDAIAMYTTVATERTESRVGAEAALAVARIENAAGNLPGAIAALEGRLQTATTTDGNDAVYVELAKAYRAAGKPADAVRVARELLNFYPESTHIPEGVIELTRALDENGESRQALELAQQAADRFDKNAEVAKNRALMLSKTKDTRAAAEALVQADKLGANDPEVLLEAGLKYQELAESDKALDLLKKVIEKYPDSVQAVDAGVQLGRNEYKTGAIAAAIDRLAALSVAPNASMRQLEIQSALGDIYTDLGLSKRATAAYEKVATLATDPEMLARAAIVLLENGAMGSALPVIKKVDEARLPSKTGFEFLMAQGRAMLNVDAVAALDKMQQAFEQYPVERTPEDFEYLVRACLETGKTANARILVSDFDAYVEKHPEDSGRLQRTAALWGDALYNAGDFRGALDAYALAVPKQPEPKEGESTEEAATEEPAPLSRDAIWAKYQRANAMLKLDDYSNSLPILDELAGSDTPYAEDARIKAEYARLEQRMRGGPQVIGQGG